MPGEMHLVDYDHEAPQAKQWEKLNFSLRRIFTLLDQKASGGSDTGGGGGTMDHSKLSNLGYAVSGHTGFAATVHAHPELVPIGRKINTTAPLTGGGALSADLTLAITQGEGSTLDSDKVDSHHAWELAPYWGFPNKTDSVYSFSYPTFTISPVSGSFTFYRNGVKYTKTTAQTADITDTEGVWFIYFNSSGVLVASQTPWSIESIVSVAVLYWDAANNSALILADERHGPVMDQVTHMYLHETIGTRFESGLLVSGTTTGNGDNAIDAEIGVTNGVIHDEDNEVQIVHAASPSPPYQQILTLPAQIPVFYRSGTAAWRMKAANNYPVLEGAYFTPSRTRCSYNQFTGGSWTQTELANLDFFAVWIFATNDINHPIIAILGQRTDGTLTNAQNNNTYNSLSLGTMPIQEFKVIARIIFQTGNGYSNVPKARMREIVDYRNFSVIPTAGFPVATAHSSLTGLGADDHLQYLHTDGRRPMAGALGPAVVTLSDAGTILTDATLGNHFRVTLGGNRTLGNPSGAYDGQRFLWELRQDATGGRVLTLDSKFVKPTNIPNIVLTTSPSVSDLLGVIYNSSLDKFIITGFLTEFT